MASIEKDIISITPTIYGIHLQTIKKLGIPFNLIENTTLNEKFDVQAGVTPAPGVLPSMRYLVIGNLGHHTVTADDGSDETIPVPHRSSDAAPFNAIPFVLREVSNELSSDERSKYALRVEEEHNGKNYFAYYARRIPMDDVISQLQRYVVDDDGVLITSPFVPNSDNLNPERPEISNNGTVLGSDSNIGASAVMRVVLSANDIAEIRNAHQIRTGSTRSPVISELVLCSGVDRDVTGASGGSGTFTYREVIACQANVFLSVYHALGYSSNEARFNIDVGSSEPLIGEDDVVNATFL